MKTIRHIIILLLLLHIQSVAYSQFWELVWSDEFNYSGLPDQNKWEFEVHGPGWVNQERQNYTNRRLENCRVENGRLIIEARRDWFGGHEYSSARIRTAHKGDWLYGRVEVRAKLPAGRGTWPAIWMLPTDWSYGGWPASGEIDIMEYVGYQPDVVHASVHTRDRNFMHGNNYTVAHYNNTVEEQFNVYALEWYRDRLDFFVNNVKIGTFTNGGNWTVWPFDKRFHMILNLAIGGNWGGAQGIDNNIFPARMEVDYVRVYRESPQPPGVTNLSGVYYLQNRHSGLYMDVSGSGTTDGANVHQWAYHGNANQQFNFTHLGNGVYRITAVHSGKALDVAGVSSNDGANIQQWSYGGGANQQFIVQSTGDGYYRLIASHSRKIVEVGGWSTSSGGNIQQWSSAGQTSGQWRLVPVVTSTLIQAENYSAMAGVQTENTTDSGGGLNVGWIDAGDWMAYNSINFPVSGSYRIEYRVASPNSGGRLSLDLNAGSVQLGSINVPNTGGWQNWTTISHVVNVNAGTYNLGIFAPSGGWNINWIRITRQTATAARMTAMEEAVATLEFFPNPAEDILHIRGIEDLSGFDARIYDAMGFEVDNLKPESGSIDVSLLKAGIYSIVLTRDDMKITRKFMKK
ncbi:MAG: RICIN domain-containing protein [Cytophagaceae bacterium]